MIARTKNNLCIDNQFIDDTVYIKLFVYDVMRYRPEYDLSSNGILISRYESDCGRIFELRIDGEASVINHGGQRVNVLSWYAEYIKRGQKEMLQFCKIPILRLIEISPETEDPIESVFHGVYYRVSDAEKYLTGQFRNMIFSDMGSPSI